MVDDVVFGILAAGRGTRLGRDLPKPLTVLADGSSIMGRQVAGIRSQSANPRICVVVGFKSKAIMRSFPALGYVLNDAYATTNTSKSLLALLEATGSRGVVWMNGDVVFDTEVLARVDAMVERGSSCVVVNTASTGEEEVKYTCAPDGSIRELSKRVANAEGEAVGVNFVSAADKPMLIEMLSAVDDQDYFERGIELAIDQGAQFVPVDVSDLLAVEIDFEDDLNSVNTLLDEAG